MPLTRVITCHFHRQRPDGLRRARPPWNAARVRPALLGKIGVLAQHRPRGDDQARLPEAAPGQQPGQRRQDRPVGPRQLRRLDLALEDGNLMTQEQDLGILARAERARRASQPNTRSTARYAIVATRAPIVPDPPTSRSQTANFMTFPMTAKTQVSGNDIVTGTDRMPGPSCSRSATGSPQ